MYLYAFTCKLGQSPLGQMEHCNALYLDYFAYLSDVIHFRNFLFIYLFICKIINDLMISIISESGILVLVKVFIHNELVTRSDVP